MAIHANGSDSSGSLSPLPEAIHLGLTAITIVAFVSLISTSVLFSYLAYRLLTWKHRGYAHINQYVGIFVNLILADMIQAIGFVMSLEWLTYNKISASTPACWTQGWLINAGDVGSCLFTMAMAVHLFSDIVLDRRMGYATFIATIILIWIFDFTCASIGIAMHPSDFYMRAGMWCWINEKYMIERIWLHYFWVILVEFGTMFLYFITFIVLWRRVRQVFWANDGMHLRHRTESAARSVIVYPVVYVVCTLPAVIARLKIMAGVEVGYAEFTVVGVMLCSNGWLDVLCYSLTRRSLIFGPAMPSAEGQPLETLSDGNFQPEHGSTCTMKQSEPWPSSPATTHSKRPEAWERTCSRCEGSMDDSRQPGSYAARMDSPSPRAQRCTREFTADVDAVWKAHGCERGQPAVQNLDWSKFEQTRAADVRRYEAATKGDIGRAR